MAFTFILANTSAFAAPAVGDSSTYDTTITASSGTVTTVTVTETISKIDASGAVTLTQAILQNGSVISSEDSQTSVDDLNQMDYIVDHCQEIADSGSLPSGTTLKVEEVTVPAGTFNSCHMSSANQDTYLGHVPTGAIKTSAVVTDGSHIEMTLHSFVKH